MLSQLHTAFRAAFSNRLGVQGSSLAVLVLALCATHAGAAEHAMRVLHHQVIQLNSRPDAGATEHVTFDAYGRRFDLEVAPNERIRRAIRTAGSRTMPLEGTVEGVPGSWVRITRSSSGWRGMFYDGQELYAIEAAQDLAGSTDEALNASGSAPVIYRLADAVLPPEDNLSCEIVQPEADPPTAASAFQSISHELHIQAAQLSAMKQVRVGVVGDFEFSTLPSIGASPEDTIISRMNIVDGIFSTQLGVKISLAPSTIFTSPNDPFTKSKASDLLTELRSYRRNSSTQSALGLTHLMTGRDLDGNTVGIAYIGSVCQGSSASSLSEGRRNSTLSALIVAHEIGHNFNAPHDGESGACSSTPQTFLMAPRLNGSDQFSACSIAQMQPIVNNASCLSAYIPPDVALEVTAPSRQATVGTSFVASFIVRATGDDASTDVEASAAIPTGLTLQSVTASGTTCTSGAGSASCSFGAMAAGDSRQINITLTPTDTGSLALSLSVTSTNDANDSNNSGLITVTSASTAAAPSAPPSSGGGNTSTASGSSDGGGGGGRVDVATLAALLCVSLLALFRRVRARVI
jgi:Metallo-peptidase family M12B Reprolysin-like/Domain of unknown function DUF11